MHTTAQSINVVVGAVMKSGYLNVYVWIGGQANLEYKLYTHVRKRKLFIFK